VLGLFARTGEGKEPTSAEALQELWVRVLAMEGVVVKKHRALYIQEYTESRLEVDRMFGVTQ